MTPEERFAQIESILLQNTSQIATLLEGQIKLQEAQAKTDAQIAKTQEQLDSFARDTHGSIEDLVNFGTQIYEMAAENAIFIRGLQVENRRILRELRDLRNRDS